MQRISFQDIKFSKDKAGVKARFLKHYSFPIRDSVLGKYRVEGGSLITDKGEHLQIMLSEGFEKLTNELDRKPTTYIHRNSGIPLIGNISFGIIDRNTTLIEAKPATGCNLECIYCSVDETRKTRDFVIEADYLAEELLKLVEYKNQNGIEIHINSHGEPLLYEPLAELCARIRQDKRISTISIDTNGTILTEKTCEELIKAGITQFNISLNATTQSAADSIAGRPYPLRQVKEACAYLAKQGRLLLAPVLIPGINDEELPGLITLAKKLKCRIGIQNFLNYKQGKNPARQYTMKRFMEKLRNLEKEHCTKLLLTEQDFSIRKTRPLPKPYRKGDTVEALAKCPGRTKDETIAAAQDRSITTPRFEGKKMVRITGDKHNIFYAR